jgi:hypothetical protein
VLTVSCLDLCVDFNATVGGNHIIWDGDALVDWDALLDYCVVFHAADCEYSHATREGTC